MSVVEGQPPETFIPAALASWSLTGSEKDWFGESKSVNDR
jgi:hypothetical protein